MYRYIFLVNNFASFCKWGSYFRPGMRRTVSECEPPNRQKKPRIMTLAVFEQKNLLIRQVSFIYTRLSLVGLYF